MANDLNACKIKIKISTFLVKNIGKKPSFFVKIMSSTDIRDSFFNVGDVQTSGC